MPGSTPASKINFQWFGWLTKLSRLLLLRLSRASPIMLQTHAMMIIYLLYPPQLPPFPFRPNETFTPALESSLLPNLNPSLCPMPDGIHPSHCSTIDHSLSLSTSSGRIPDDCSTSHEGLTSVGLQQSPYKSCLNLFEKFWKCHRGDLYRQYLLLDAPNGVLIGQT